MTYVEHTHYYFTPSEMDVRSGKGPGCHQHDAALCGYGSFHFKRTKNKAKVTCEKCKNLLSAEKATWPFPNDPPKGN